MAMNLGYIAVYVLVVIGAGFAFREAVVESQPETVQTAALAFVLGGSFGIWYHARKALKCWRYRRVR